MRPLAILFMLISTPVCAQVSRPIANESTTVPRTSIATGQVGEEAIQVSESNPFPVKVASGYAKQEAFQLASSNVAASPITAFGGNYIFSQQCSSYGTISLQVRGPDNVTYQTISSQTAAQSAGGNLVSIGSGAVIRVLLAGTTGCAASLSRVPS